MRYLGSTDLFVKIAENVTLIFLVLCFNVLLLPRVFESFFADAKWTIFRRALFTLYNLLSVGFVSFLHAHYRGHVAFTLASMLHFELYALLIGSLPVAFFVMLNRMQMLVAHLRTAEDLNRRLGQMPFELGQNRKLNESRTVRLTSENGQEKRLFADSLILFASADNYVIIFAAREDRIKKEFFRCSLTRIEEALRRHPEFLRCHRSCIVNLRKVKAVSGNSQGYRLALENMTRRVPVARSHAREFKRRMETLSTL